jgi:hypothetical protein
MVEHTVRAGADGPEGVQVMQHGSAMDHAVNRDHAHGVNHKLALDADSRQAQRFEH